MVNDVLQQLTTRFEAQTHSDDTCCWQTQRLCYILCSLCDAAHSVLRSNLTYAYVLVHIYAGSCELATVRMTTTVLCTCAAWVRINFNEEGGTSSQRSLRYSGMLSCFEAT